MAPWGAVRRAVLAVGLLAGLLAAPQPARAALGVLGRADPLPGVVVQRIGGDGLSVNLGRIAKGAPVRIEAFAAGAIAGGMETTSAVCRRGAAILCVNGDFTECRTCSSAFGGIIHDGALQRSPVSNHPQLWLGPAGPGAGPLRVGTTLEATLTYVVQSPPVLGGLLPPPPPQRRVETVSLAIDAVNRGRGADQVLLYTPSWAPSTTTPNGGAEAVLGGGPPTIGANVPVSVRAWKGDVGNTAIPGDGMVLSGTGSGSARLQAFWSKAADPAAAQRSITLKTSSDRAAEESLGGHPVILADGRTVISGSTDPFATNRHPRTLVGWNPAGELLLMTVDGRQPGHSQGVSLVEAADLLRRMGATNGFNLDGGGSTTFVSLASGGTAPRVLNRPSDGNERRVTTVLAVVPLNPAAVRLTGAPAEAPPPPPAPPGPPPPDEASSDGLPATPAAAAPTTTTAPPTTVPVPSTTLPPVPETVPAEVVTVELAAPPPPPPSLPAKRSTGAAAAVAAFALGAAAAATGRSARRSRRRT